MVMATLCGLWLGVASAADLLWRVEGGAGTAYLAGSVHLLPPEAYPLPASFEQAYRRADRLVFETDMGALNNPATQMQLLSAATLPAGQTLSERLPADLRKRLESRLKEGNMPLALVDGFRPWFAAVMLEMTLFMNSGYRPDLGLDQHFYDRAHADGKPIESLEPIAGHLEILTGMTEAEQQNFLAATLAELERLEDAPAQLFELWRQGDVKGLEALMLDSRQRYPGFHERLIASRNRQWVKRIRSMLAEGDVVMVVVGAIHLIGEDGLPARLRAAGFPAVQQ